MTAAPWFTQTVIKVKTKNTVFFDRSFFDPAPLVPPHLLVPHFLPSLRNSGR